MEKIRRKIKLFFNLRNNPYLALLVIILIFLFALKTLDTYVAKENKRKKEIKESKNTEVSVIAEETKEKAIKEEQIRKDNIKDEIENFIDYCDYHFYDDAYSMLAEQTKQNLYKTKQEFINNFVRKKIDYDERYYYNILEDDTCIVQTMQNQIETGGIEKFTNIFTCKLIEENGEKKILIIEEGM